MKNIYKTFFLLILIPIAIGTAFSIHNSFSQTAPGIEWQNTIGGNKDDRIYYMQQTIDSAYVFGGTSNSNISGDKTESCNGLLDYWIVKTDLSGNIIWQNTIGGNNEDWLHWIQQTADGGYILGGASASGISGDKTGINKGYADYWIVKTDVTGNIQWQNTIGGNKNDQLSCIRQTADGGYILGGYSYSDISGDKAENNVDTISPFTSDYWIMKTDSSGNIQWQNTIGGSSEDQLYSIQQTIDGGYVLGGFSVSDSSGDKTENSNGLFDYWIVKTDSSGNIQWQNTIGGSGSDEFFSMQQTTDGGYILGGRSESDSSGDKTENTNGSWDYWIVKTDSVSTIQWQKTIGGNDDDNLYSVLQTADGGYILGGESNSNISGDKTENSKGDYDYWILKTDAAGNITWQKTIGGSNVDILLYHSIQQTFDYGYILGGYSFSDSSGDKTENTIGLNGYADYWIVKLTPDTITSITQLPQLPDYPITISPNPLTTQSKLTFKNPNKETFLFTLYDITGRVTESVSTTNNEIILTKGSKPAGVYLFNLMNEKTGERWNGKIVISD